MKYSLIEAINRNKMPEKKLDKLKFLKSLNSIVCINITSNTSAKSGSP